MKNKILLFLFLKLLLVDYAFAANMKITLENNTYKIRSNCATPEEPTYYSSDYTCHKVYIIELRSKYHVFNNYSTYHAPASSPLGQQHHVSIETSLYNFRFGAYVPNKSIMYIYIDEDDLKKLLKADEARIKFDLSLFSKKLLDKELKDYNRRTGSYAYSYDVLEPSVTIDLKAVSLQDLISECTQEHIQCNQKLESLNTPMKRLKRFFN